MNTSPMQIYDTAFYAFALGALRLTAGDKVAVLLDARYVPDLGNHATFADIQAFELAGGQYRRQQLTGARLVPLPGAICFTSDPLNWGNPVTLAPSKYLVLLDGLAGGLKPTSALLALMDLTGGTGFGAVEASHGAFAVTPPNSGWFEIRAGILEQ